MYEQLAGIAPGMGWGVAVVLGSKFWGSIKVVHLPLPRSHCPACVDEGEWSLGSFACGRWEGTLAFLLAGRGCSAGMPGRSYFPKRWGLFKKLRLGLCALAAVAWPCQGIGRLCPLCHLFYLWLKRAQQKGHGR